tara:strand:- start:3235 stop:3336 length:102 start_codon:yes stop_codon:yes gene_type:complete
VESGKTTVMKVGITCTNPKKLWEINENPNLKRK